MAARTSAKLGIKRTSSAEPDLRYDNLSSVLLKLDGKRHGPANSQCDRAAGEYPTQLAALHAEIVSLKTENERELDRFAERVEELEAWAHRPWWGRVFHRSGQTEPGKQPRRQAVARLRALCLDRPAADYRPA